MKNKGLTPAETEIIVYELEGLLAETEIIVYELEGLLYKIGKILQKLLSNQEKLGIATKRNMRIKNLQK